MQVVESAGKANLVSEACGLEGRPIRAAAVGLAALQPSTAPAVDFEAMLASMSSLPQPDGDALSGLSLPGLFGGDGALPEVSFPGFAQGGAGAEPLLPAAGVTQPGGVTPPVTAAGSTTPFGTIGAADQLSTLAGSFFWPQLPLLAQPSLALPDGPAKGGKKRRR